MKFSIIVPVFNVEKYLVRCLDSLVAQTYSDFEVILIDDGSTDSSGIICDSYAGRYHFKVIHQQNQGQSAARNCGLNVACGEWIVFVDSDDWIEKDMLEELARQIRERPADIYGFNARKKYENGSPDKKLLYVVENETVVFDSEQQKFSFYFDRLMQYNIGWEACFHIYKRDIIECHSLRFIDTQQIFAEDYLFTFQYILYVRRFELICNIFYNYFQRRSSSMGNVDKQTVLPRLMRWGQYAYHAVSHAHLPYFQKNFYKLYFLLLNYHIQYLLADQTKESIEQCLESHTNDRFHKNVFSKVRKRSVEFEKYMVMMKWL